MSATAPFQVDGFKAELAAMLAANRRLLEQQETLAKRLQVHGGGGANG